MLQKELRKQLADNIKQSADFGHDCAIQTCVGLIRMHIANKNMDAVESCLKDIEQLCTYDEDKSEQNYRAFMMMYNLSLC